ncbi:cobalt ECF transporter T component CbiQ [Paenibacillus solisilvae]|uniref:Cobalt ECF transporter T component CbiQ n=1 Tax=Paenibacillus solisilvae TaxID=2486751 RepID=A0ABW0VTX8_9BACL
MIKLIDSLSYLNKLRSVSPLWKCGFAAVLFVLSYLSHPIIQLVVFSWIFIWIVLYARIPFKFYILLMGTPCLFYATGLPAIMIELQSIHASSALSPVIAQFSFMGWAAFVTESGLYKAGHLFMRVLACLSCLTFMMLTTPISELFQVMKKLHMPSLILELMLIMYRFLFVLTDTASQMYSAQKARGGQSRFRSRLSDTAILIVRLFGKTMQRYKGLSHGLSARGFTDEIRMAPYRSNPVPPRYKWESGIGIALLLLLELWIRWRETT